VNLVNQDINLSIPLDRTVDVSLPDAPVNVTPGAAPGTQPTVTRVLPFLRFGGEGSLAYTDAVAALRNQQLDTMPDVPGELLTFIAGAFTTDGANLVTQAGKITLSAGDRTATGTGSDWSTRDFTGQPQVNGKILVVDLPDGSRFATNVVTASGDTSLLLQKAPTVSGNNLTYHIGNPGLPESIVVQNGVGDLRGGVTIQPVLGLPELVSPTQNGVMSDRTLRWKAAAGQVPTLHDMEVYDPIGFKVLWSFFIDGARTKVPIPRVPERDAIAASLPPSQSLPEDFVPPADMPVGAMEWLHESIFVPDLDYDNWSDLDISFRARRAWTQDQHLFVHGAD
jgi:hypothetical protein